MTRGQRLRRLRRASGREVEELAAAMGLPAATLLAWEADIEAPGPDDLGRLAGALGVDPAELEPGGSAASASGICGPVDLTPDAGQAEVLEQVGLPPRLWRDAETWLAFLRLAQAAAKLSGERLSALAHNAETCAASSQGPLPYSGNEQ